MKLASLLCFSFVFVGVVVLLATSIFITIVDASDDEFSMTPATPATTSGGSFANLFGCAKDNAETHAFCGGGTYYLVKFTLNPIAFSSELSTSYYLFSVALYEEEGGTSRVFYIDNGKIKFVPASSLASPITVGSTSTTYSVDYLGQILVNHENDIIFFSNSYDSDKKIYKIVNISSSTPVVDSDEVISMSQGQAADLALANGDLYVAHNTYSTESIIARVPNPSSSSAAESKSITLTGSDYGLAYGFNLFTTGNTTGFLYVVGHKYGSIAKLSIGATDTDFALVGRSFAIGNSTADEAGARSWLLTPDLSHVLVICSDLDQVHHFDIEAFAYKSNVSSAGSNPEGGFLTSNGSVAIASGSTLYLYNFDITTPTTTSSPSSSSSSSSGSLSPSGKLGVGIGIGVGVPALIAATVAIIFLAKAATASAAAGASSATVASNSASNNAPDETNNPNQTNSNDDHQQEMDVV